MRAKGTKSLSMYWIVVSMLLLFAVPALSWGATISGTVRDSSGTPITGNRVSVGVYTGDPCGNPQWIEGTDTDPADGTYTAVVAAGTYYLRTQYNETNYVNEWWTGASPDPSDHDCSLAQSISVTSGDTITNTDFRLEEAATISGTVRDSSGAPVTGKRVSVSVYTGDPCGNTQHVEGTGTDPTDGTYTVVVPAGTYSLLTHYYETQYVNEWWTGASPDPSDRDCSLANSITVASGDTIANTDFRLEEGATISGTVRDSSGTPITGNSIGVGVITGDPCGNYQGVEGTVTDPADGTYSVVVPAGSYSLRTHYNETNYVNEWWTGANPDPSDYDCSLAQTITVAPGDAVTNTDFWLEKGATISGTMRDSGGTPITGNRVSVDVFTGDPCGNTQDVKWTETDPDSGTYTVVVPAGTYYLQTHYNETNYVNEWWTGASPDPSDRDCGLASFITVASGDTITNTDFRLEESATISGTVRDSSGTPVTGNPVTVDVFTGDPCGNAQYIEGTGADPADGTYTAVVAAGTYYLRTQYNETNYVNEWWTGASPDPSDYDCSLANFITVASGDTITNTDFRLEEAATISGTVRDSGGTAITGDRVSVDIYTGDPCGNHQGVWGTVTDPSDGTYTVAVPAGTYYLRTHYNETNYVNEWWTGAGPDSSDSDCSLANSITVASSDTITNTDFRLEEGATISGTVRDSSGTPITGDHVSVDFYNGDPCNNTQHVEGTWTDLTDGSYAVVVPAGTYYLRTYHNETHYVNEWWTGASPDPSDRDCSLAASITVASGDAVTNTDFKLDLDSDGDGIRDYDEINVYGTNPNLADTGGDGIHDGDELNYWGPDWDQDPDSDGKNNLVDEDSDNDGYLDGAEIFGGSDPTDAGFTPQNYLYEDFSGTYIGSQRWSSREFVRQVSGGHLVSKLGNSGSGYTRNGTGFQNSATITTIKCEITIVTANLDSGNNPISFARIGGYFYNRQASGGATGDIWAEVQIGDRGSGLEAFWEVEEALDDDGNDWATIGSGAIIVPGTLNFGTAYTAILAYDGSNNFTFTVAGQTDSFAGPTPLRESVIQLKQQATGIDGGSDAGNGYVHALFDDVYVNDDAAAYDDFSSAPLDPTLWDSREIVREINGDHELLLAAHSEGQREQSTLYFAEFQPYVEAKVFVKSENQVFNGAVGRIRIDGYFFNDTHAPGEYNGYEGNVWAQIYIDLYDDGTLRAMGYVGKSMNSDESDWADLYWDEFSIPIQTDREYTLGIHHTGDHFVFKCKDNVTLAEQYKTYTIPASNQYPAYDQFTSLMTRIYGNGSGNGYMKVLVDDVYVGTAPAPSCPGDSDTDGDVDGHDLALFAAGGGNITLEEFAQDFGKTGCP